MNVHVVSYADMSSFATETVFPTARWIALKILGTSIWLFAAAKRMLKPLSTTAKLSVESATLYFEDGKAIALPTDQATQIVQRGSVPWVDDADESDSPTLEIRYVFHGKKFRALAKKGEKFPALAEEGGHVNPPKVFAATLVATPEGKAHLDITYRMLKYMGPKGDWHGASVGVRDMFPNHDVSFMEKRGYDIEIVDDRLNTIVVPFEGDTIISDIIPTKRA